MTHQTEPERDEAPATPEVPPVDPTKYEPGMGNRDRHNGNSHPSTSE